MHPMNVPMGITTAAMAFLGFLLSLWGIFVTIFFMVCAWRAMKAHEEIAKAQTELSKKSI